MARHHDHDDVVTNTKDKSRPKPGDRHSMEYGRGNNMSKLPIRPRVARYGHGGTKDAADATIQWLQDAPAASDEVAVVKP